MDGLMTPITELIIDLVLAGLLIAVIYVSYIVYRRLDIIRKGQADMQSVVNDLNHAVLEAQKSVSDLKQSSRDAVERLEVNIGNAQKVADELTLITEAGNNLADRIEAGLVRNENKAPVSNETGEKQQSASSKQQQEILAALREAR